LTQHELTWFPPRRCWKKKHRGKVYYCPIPCQNKADYSAYKESLDWWRQKQQELDCSVERLKTGIRVAAGRALEKMTFENATEGMPRPPAFEEWKEAKDAVAIVRAQKAHQVDPAETVRAFADRFLSFKRGQAVSKQKSNGRFLNLRTYTNQLVEFVGAAKPVGAVNWTVILHDYYQQQLRGIEAGTITEYTARDRMQVARQFIRRCWELGAIEIPRNLDSKEMQISASAQKIVLPDFAAVVKMIGDAPEQWDDFYPLKLYLLLMANCGMTQKDVADLLHTQVDYEAGTITRKRSKKQRKTEAKVPTVTYTLWPVTLDLLKRYRNLKSDRVLTTPAGTPLRATTLSKNADHGGANTDNIADQYNLWTKAVGLTDAPTLKRLRKLSSTKLGEHKEFGRYAQFFLAETAKTVAEKFYVVPAQHRFDAAVKWLGKQYGFVEAPRRK